MSCCPGPRALPGQACWHPRRWPAWEAAPVPGLGSPDWQPPGCQAAQQDCPQPDWCKVEVGQADCGTLPGHRRQPAGRRGHARRRRGCSTAGRHALAGPALAGVRVPERCGRHCHHVLLSCCQSCRAEGALRAPVHTWQAGGHREDDGFKGDEQARPTAYGRAEAPQGEGPGTEAGAREGQPAHGRTAGLGSPGGTCTTLSRAPGAGASGQGLRAHLQAMGMPYCTRTHRQRECCRVCWPPRSAAPAQHAAAFHRLWLRLTEVVSAMVLRATMAEKATVDCVQPGVRGPAGGARALPARPEQQPSSVWAHLEQSQPQHCGDQHGQPRRTHLHARPSSGRGIQQTCAGQAQRGRAGVAVRVETTLKKRWPGMPLSRAKDQHILDQQRSARLPVHEACRTPGAALPRGVRSSRGHACGMQAGSCPC